MKYTLASSTWDNKELEAIQSIIEKDRERECLQNY